MAAVKEKVGRMSCPSCGSPVLVRRNASDTLSIACDECDLSAFARRGAKVHGEWLKACGAAPSSSSSSKAPAPAPAKKPTGPGPLDYLLGGSHGA